MHCVATQNTHRNVTFDQFSNFYPKMWYLLSYRPLVMKQVKTLVIVCSSHLQTLHAWFNFKFELVQVLALTKINRFELAVFSFYHLLLSPLKYVILFWLFYPIIFRRLFGCLLLKFSLWNFRSTTTGMSWWDRVAGSEWYISFLLIFLVLRPMTCSSSKAIAGLFLLWSSSFLILSPYLSNSYSLASKALYMSIVS